MEVPVEILFRLYVFDKNFKNLLKKNNIPFIKFLSEQFEVRQTLFKENAVDQYADCMMNLQNAIHQYIISKSEDFEIGDTGFPYLVYNQLINKQFNENIFGVEITTTTYCVVNQIELTKKITHQADVQIIPSECGKNLSKGENKITAHEFQLWIDIKFNKQIETISCSVHNIKHCTREITRTPCYVLIINQDEPKLYVMYPKIIVIHGAEYHLFGKILHSPNHFTGVCQIDVEEYLQFDSLTFKSSGNKILENCEQLINVESNVSSVFYVRKIN